MNQENIILGWRSYQASAARVSHEMVGDKAVCGKSVALTTTMILATPRAFPPKTLEKLTRLPKCGACLRKEKYLARPKGTRATRLRIEELEAENERLKEIISHYQNDA